MAQDDHEIEHHLTPRGWVDGSERVNGRPTKTVEPPPDRIETWIELISDSSEGWDPPVVSSKLVWESPNVSAAVRAELNLRFSRPEVKPWKKVPKKKRKLADY
jgi:hypothetical protein